ncbi:glycoside hydrolase family 16 protein [Acrodontium crateriforme]|uniref:endo-1,3(4)-beta-glucanase n=1 Tax=Acrodontium crateriforme TaxID=150365 RepID=A0AAQ3M1G9_9PEZI|nr:glycoside hydrolase family 16 protein [Acrodontium crateriforme]
MPAVRTSLAVAALTSIVSASTIPYQIFYHTDSNASMPYSDAPVMYSEWANAAYRHVETYDSSNFFKQFQFITGPDPTHGYVDYVTHSEALRSGIANTNNRKVHIGVDHTTYNPSGGRKSIRLSSLRTYTHGLFIADIEHMPSSACGSWPAFWTFGSGWPNQGEIDIIEGVNAALSNTITLHTSPGCVINVDGSQDGTSSTGTNCNAGNGNSGCGVTTRAPYGDTFNSQGGGVYAMQWESSGVYVWFFPRDRIPADISHGAPRTQNWGLPIVAFNGGPACNVDEHFANHNIIFDTTFCGDWAGSVWSQGSCAHRADTCQEYVANNPGAFVDSYWSINSLKVYQL